MLQFLQRLFCFHHYDYESDIFNQAECRKCGKVKIDQPYSEISLKNPFCSLYSEFAGRITAIKAPRILDVEGFSFFTGGAYGHSICTKGIKRTLRPD